VLALHCALAPQTLSKNSLAERLAQKPQRYNSTVVAEIIEKFSILFVKALISIWCGTTPETTEQMMG